VSAKTIVCIGAGAGASLLAHHLKRTGFPGRIILLDREAGNGPAYAGCDLRHVLNVPAGNMGPAREDPAGFLRWLNGLGIDPPVAAADFVPRQLYGRYLEALLEPLRSSGAVIRVRSAASTLVREGEQWRVDLERGGTLSADAVVLAIGNLPPRALPGSACIDERLIVNDPWRCRLDDIAPPRAQVLFIGTGLTMVDGVLSLAPAANAGAHLTALSRHGRLPLAWGTQAKASFEAAWPARSLRELMRQVREHASAGGSWQQTMNGVRVQARTLWMQLSSAEQARFLRHGRTLWSIHRHRIPDPSHARLEALQQTGRLAIVAGRLEGLCQVGNRVQARWRRRGQSGMEEATFDLVINATGPESRYERSRDPLLQQLFAAGHVQAHPLGLGLDATAAGELRAADGSIVPRLYSLGAPIQGVLFECTAIPDIRDAAQDLAALLCRRL
jgi:uncharacterized NAD(P)/FAD-binding protein YdhS